MASLLIVEDESSLRSSMVRGLAKLPDLSIYEAGTLTRAIELMTSAQPSLIISDLDLPDGSGIEILSAMDRLGLRVPLIFISAYLDKYRAHIPARSDVDMCEKPIRLEALRKLVNDRLERAKPGEGAAPFAVDEYIQLACMGQHSISIQIEGLGEIVIRAGEIWSAKDALGSGEEALRRLLGISGKSITCQTLRAHDGTRNIAPQPWIGLLIEAARRRDEATAPIDDVGRLIDRELEKVTSNDFDLWLERGIEATLDKNYREALRAFENAKVYRPEDPTVRANIKRLTELLR